MKWHLALVPLALVVAVPALAGPFDKSSKGAGGGRSTSLHQHHDVELPS
jgi:hypothetical protein